jgi:hypothetical protein
MNRICCPHPPTPLPTPSSLPPVCPKGFFQADPAAASCVRCAQNQYCPGGDKVESPTNFGANFTCGANLVTRNTGARTASDCLAPAGYALSGPGEATACGVSTYAPALNRLGRCLRCQSGLAENPASNLQDGDRDSKRRVCSEYLKAALLHSPLLPPAAMQYAPCAGTTSVRAFHVTASSCEVKCIHSTRMHW